MTKAFIPPNLPASHSISSRWCNGIFSTTDLHNSAYWKLTTGQGQTASPSEISEVTPAWAWENGQEIDTHFCVVSMASEALGLQAEVSVC